ncbi:MAG: cytochrome c maturation protein CcmE [Alteromonadaceae bacterium]|nr:MAG: cytochrome c maturation protein CcmE [Alteromonadaceae bacterium]
MHPLRKQRLITVIFIVIASSALVGLVLYALSENLNHFYPPTKIVSGEAPVGKTIRAGGCVVPGSVKRDGKTLVVRFDLTGGTARFSVDFEGILPDLFGEGEAAVVIGQLESDGVFKATEVLAKHDENYMPPEVDDALNADNDGSEHQRTCEALDYAS